jgi:hypothetical protein
MFTLYYLQFFSQRNACQCRRSSVGSRWQGARAQLSPKSMLTLCQRRSRYCRTLRGKYCIWTVLITAWISEIACGKWMKWVTAEVTARRIMTWVTVWKNKKAADNSHTPWGDLTPWSFYLNYFPDRLAYYFSLLGASRPCHFSLVLGIFIQQHCSLVLGSRRALQGKSRGDQFDETENTCAQS